MARSSSSLRRRWRIGTAEEEIPIRAGHVISRLPGTGIAQGLRARTRTVRPSSPTARAKPGDICYYPRSNKIYFKGLGLIARLEDLDYDDGEPGQAASRRSAPASTSILSETSSSDESSSGEWLTPPLRLRTNSIPASTPAAARMPAS